MAAEFFQESGEQGVSGNMKLVVSVVLGVLVAPVALAFYTTGLSGEGNGVSFSKEFREAYQAARPDGSDPASIKKLTGMAAKFQSPHEQAEIALTLGVIYGQRTGLVNPKKAVPQFTKALKGDLPATVRTQVFLWRGNALEQQKRLPAALPDYIRGLMMCTQFDLSHGWPKDPPQLKEDQRAESAVDPEELKRPRSGPGRSGADSLQQTRLIRVERRMLMHRYYLIEAVKRMAKKLELDVNDLEDEIAHIVSDSRRATQILVWCQDKNERPWP